ncbi:MAG: hypothetical protein JSR42_11475 [Proteobacteria bacterium]|nr:hypothetical protein [Pseudomonadota bacterium]MBS0551181.1 hypothetical protein [Pseudomonadota bacterium]
MNRRQFLTLSGTSVLLGCANAETLTFSDEEFIIGAWNACDRELEDVRVEDARNPEKWWFSQLGQHPRPIRPDTKFPLRPSFGGDQRSGRIPDAVTVQWREMPPPGAKPYTGELKGPFLITGIRSRIPADRLRMAREPLYVLSVEFSAGVEPIRFDWMLRRFSEGGRGGTKEIAFGGDSFK